MIILGIDPGTAITGYGVVECTRSRQQTRVVDYGCIRTPAGLPDSDRLKSIYSETCTIIDRYKPDAVTIEQLFFNRNVTTALAVGQARGVVILAAANSGIEIAEYTPLQVKQSVTGYGRADKSQIQRMVKVLLSLTEVPKPDDVADALAVALCHSYSLTFGSLQIRSEAKR